MKVLNWLLESVYLAVRVYVGGFILGFTFGFAYMIGKYLFGGAI